MTAEPGVHAEGLASDPQGKPGFPTEMLAAVDSYGSLLALETKPSCKVSPSPPTQP